jgi:TonB family protein
MKAVTIILLLASTASAVTAQTIENRATNTFRMHYVVSPADGDPSAKTDEEINAVNLRLAASGNTDADFQLGLAYMQGVGVGQDLAKAERYFEIGAIKPGDKELVANFYLEHGWFTYSPEKAVGWLLAAGRSGDLFEAAQTYRKFNPPQETKAAGMYRALLEHPESAEFRRAQMELGNLVLDGKYSAGDDAASHALNLEWARIITQELLGQQEYTIAVAYAAAVDGVPKDDAMWLRFCKHAAAYNMDLAQRFYGQAILDHEIKNVTPLEGYAWVRLASDKQYSNKVKVQQLEQQMSPNELLEANSVYEGLVQTRLRDGAYYSSGDPLSEPSAAELKSMPDDDPDVQLRRAFALESSGKPEDYEQAMRLYRIARDRRGMDVKVVLGRDYLYGSEGVTKDPRLAKYWLTSAAEAGSKPAALYLTKWYSGEGGGAVDTARAAAWARLGTDKAANLTADQLSTVPAAGQQPATPAPATNPTEVQSDAGSAPDKLMHIGGGVQRPIVIQTVPPVYSPEARAAKFSGEVLLYLWVDKNGNPLHIRVVKGVGMGLDENAVEAVRKYKFKPATLNGEPVVVDLYIKVNFQIR